MPEYIIWSARYGGNNRPGGPYRMASSEEEVRRVVAGLRGWYGESIEILVFRIGDLVDATAEFVGE